MRAWRSTRRCGERPKPAPRTQLLDLAEYGLGFAGRADGAEPESVATSRSQVQEADGIILGTQEYHGSYSGV